MFWHRKSATDNADRLREAISRPVGSLRTRCSLVTAVFLLLGLGFCYVGGRIVLSELVQDADQEFRQIGSRLSLVVLRHEERVVKELAAFAETLRPQLEQGRLNTSDVVEKMVVRTAEGPMCASLAVRLNADGSVRDGFCWNATGGVSQVKREIGLYGDVFARWRETLAACARTPPLGIISLLETPHYVIMTALEDGGFQLTGRRFEESLFVSDMQRNLPGMTVRPCKRTARQPASASAAGPESLVRLLDSRLRSDIRGDSLTFAMVDVLGTPVSVVSVMPPRTYAALAVIALGRYSVLIALVGILMTLPIFWIQGRLLLDPLSRMTQAVTELASRRIDTDCPRIEWKGRDEFAQLAESVNRMLERISARAISVVNLEHRHQALINGLPDALAIFDGQGRLVSITKEAEGVDPLPGLTRGEPPDGAVFGFPEADRFVTLVAETLRIGNIGELRLKVQRPKGIPKEVPTRHFELRLTRMDEHFVIAIIRDVSKSVGEHKLRLAAERRVLDSEKRESLTSLAAGIAHDMNNVLSIVLNAAEAADADPSGDSAMSLGTIRDAVRRGTSMMRELQTFAGDNRIELHRVSPNLVLDDVMQLASRVVSDNIILTSNVEADVPDVDVDPNQFWKVIFNILKNASEAIGDAPGRIRVNVVPFKMSELEATNFVSEHPLSSGPGVLFCIEDDGCGIPQDILSRLFDPYVSSKALGRGLGLATVRTIVEAHLGGIRVSSEPSRGTMFQIFLPASKSGKTLSMKRPVLDTAGSRPAISGGEVLVVDNDDAILKTTSILLKALKLDSHVAHDRREALAIVRRRAKRLKAILLDAHLGGVDTVRLLNAFRIGAPNVPVVVISGSSPAEMEEMFKPHPYDAFLAKPYTLQELNDILASLTPPKHA